MCVCVYMYVQVRSEAREHIVSPELELQVVVSHPSWVLKI